MQVGQVVDFVIAYNERHKEETAVPAGDMLCNEFIEMKCHVVPFLSSILP